MLVAKNMWDKIRELGSGFDEYETEEVIVVRRPW